MYHLPLVPSVKQGLVKCLLLNNVEDCTFVSTVFYESLMRECGGKPEVYVAMSTKEEAFDEEVQGWILQYEFVFDRASTVKTRPFCGACPVEIKGVAVPRLDM
ncbi:hypothetical protein ANCCAN_20877 [Ancylostoma caninum]|uniref:Uncharacterized protein n=1 Tax=Ancylostoma caninum TaxID=29170 RepID=A0A368FM82_ANCCA|nr:hypothetical protein ANCCAN_20877 [Ancylostoma caninum]